MKRRKTNGSNHHHRNDLRNTHHPELDRKKEKGVRTMPYSDARREMKLQRIAAALERIADALEKQNAGADIKIQGIETTGAVDIILNQLEKEKRRNKPCMK